MKNFQNILYVASGFTDGTDGLIQALSLARNNNAALKILALYPKQIESMADLDNFKKMFLQQVESTLDATCNKYQIAKSELKISISLLSSVKPVIQIVQHVLKEANDLVIKEVESKDTKGFEAIDMALLRQCPCPVWLCRPLVKHRNELSVAVAIDPNSEEEAARKLSIRLLEFARSVADTCNKDLKIISCWDCENEEYLKNSGWINVSESELQKMVYDIQIQHLADLKGIIKDSGIGGKIDICHLRGNASSVIPEYVNNNSIDILVMGTVARTGIPGFIIGNTAENILRQLSCTLVALKPNGFISQVKV